MQSSRKFFNRVLTGDYSVLKDAHSSKFTIKTDLLDDSGSREVISTKTSFSKSEPLVFNFYGWDYSGVRAIVSGLYKVGFNEKIQMVLSTILSQEMIDRTIESDFEAENVKIINRAAADLFNLRTTPLMKAPVINHWGKSVDTKPDNYFNDDVDKFIKSMTRQLARVYSYEIKSFLIYNISGSDYIEVNMLFNNNSYMTPIKLNINIDKIDMDSLIKNVSETVYEVITNLDKYIGENRMDGKVTTDRFMKSVDSARDHISRGGFVKHFNHLTISILWFYGCELALIVL